MSIFSSPLFVPPCPISFGFDHRREVLPSSRRERRSGFALLITITLLAFLVLLLVSLASLTRVETSVASNNQQLAQARQNALTALNIALGELQKYAGPDQRATARADIQATSTVNGSSRWTGVWGNSANPQSSQRSLPVLLQWLVSGNQSTDFDPASDASSVAASFGQISGAPASWSFAPDRAVTGVSTSVTVDTPIEIDGEPAALLVGPNSAGTAGGAEADYVVAPLIEIKVSPTSIPGLGSSGDDVPVGRYAYWVGDEGVKTRINMVDPYVAPTSAMTTSGVTVDTDAPFRLMSPQRAGVERVAGFATFPVNTDAVRRVLSPEQAGFADANVTVAAHRARFHDLTGASQGVLADARLGGLKRDLTFAFAQSVANYRTALELTAGAPNPVIPVSVMPLTEQGPTWEQLHSYGNLNGAAPLAPQPQTGTQHGVYPILTQARLAFGGTTVGGAAGHRQFVLHIYPTFVLANPHNAPIAQAKYRVRMDIAAGSYLATYIGQTTTPFWRRTLREMFEGQVFELDCPQLEAGEARIFTLNSSPADEPWVAVKTYEFTNDWDAGAAKIALNTATDGGTEVPDNVLYSSGSGPGNGLGIHIAFGDNTNAAPSPSWSGNGGTYTGYAISSLGNGPQRGGTLSFSLTDASGAIYQRIETMGYAGWPISQYGIRGTGNSPGNFVPPGPDNRQGTFIFRLADSGSFTSGTRYPYYSQFNWRAPLVSRTSLFAAGSVNSLISFAQSYYIGGGTFSQWIRPDQANLLTKVEWNGAVGMTTSQPQARVNWLPFDVPRAGTGLVSLGQLQHFNAGGYNDGLVYPAPAADLGAARPSASGFWRARYVANPNPIGNSRAHPNVDRELLIRTNSGEPYYDFSYLLNQSLFDGYFFSTYPQSGPVDLATARLPNPRMKPFRTDIPTDAVENFRGGPAFAASDVRRAARNLLLEGAFNVNSTSVEAWRALLTSFQNVEYNGETGLTGAFVRSVHQSAGSANATNGISVDAWNGFRNLTTAQIDELASQIVKQIKARGVSIALADFINRKLVTAAATDADLGLAGPLQAAIDAADVSATVAARINAGFPTTLPNSSGTAVTPLTPTTSAAYNFTLHLAKHALEGIAGWLSQADLVQALAPGLSSRSDTFRIRTYGETLNPVTGTVEGRAWCEAIVQRLPDYVSDTDDAVVSPAALTDDNNKRFGRRFSVVGFRWLTPSDI